jgi:glycine/D-amino acid oxidase-like deaminating enzyme
MRAFSDVAEQVDLIIIGGGIIGTGIARDAARRGLTIALFERDDFGSGTTAASTRLIHGGLRPGSRRGLARRSLKATRTSPRRWRSRFATSGASGSKTSCFAAVSYLGVTPDRGLGAAAAVSFRMQQELHWSEERRQSEVRSYRARVATRSRRAGANGPGSRWRVRRSSLAALCATPAESWPKSMR